MLQGSRLHHAIFTAWQRVCKLISCGRPGRSRSYSDYGAGCSGFDSSGGAFFHLSDDIKTILHDPAGAPEQVGSGILAPIQ